MEMRQGVAPCIGGVGGRLAGWLAAVFLLAGFPATAGDYLIDSWDSETGLPDNFVTSVVQTPDGYLWVATYNGLARFDGDRFVLFSRENTPQLGHTRIVKLLVDGEGTLWINTYDGSVTSYRNGIFKMEWNGARQGVSEMWPVAGAKETMFSFRSGLLITKTRATGGWQALAPPEELHGAVYCVDQTSSLWCATVDGQLWRIAGGQYERQSLAALGLRGREIRWLAPDGAGRIWVGTEQELAVWDGGHFQNMSPSEDAELNVASLFFTRAGRLVVGANGRLRVWRDRRWVAEYQAWPDLMQEQQLAASLVEDRQGGLWRISRGQGLFHIRPDGTSEQLTTADGLPGNHTTGWLEDQEGNLWVSLANGGLARLRPRHFQVLGMSDGAAAIPAMSVCEDHAGTLWIGTYGGGLYRWDGEALKHFQIPAQTPGDFVFSICPDMQNRLWLSAGLEDAFVFVNGGLAASPPPVHAIKSLFVDRQGRVWMGRKDGVDCWAEGKLREWSSHNHSIPKPVRALAEDPAGVIWIGADDENIYRFAGGQPQAVPLPEFPAHQAVWSLLADPDGSLWIGTSDAGLLHFAAGRFTRFTARDGLPDDLICQLLDDQQGSLWLGTHHGICRVSRAALRAFASGRSAAITCSVYDRSDGLPTMQCSDMYQPSAWRGHDGRLWFATAKGVVGVSPAGMPVNSRPPPVVIEECSVDGTIQGLPPGGDDCAVKVPPGHQNFEFRYTALSLINADKIRFRYRLEGFDANWINAGNRRWVQYNYLKPGAYRFRVMACNNDGLWNETGAAVRLQVLPHLWETWWFLAGLGLVVAAAVAGTAGYFSHRALRLEMDRLARQRDIEQVRARIARDIHDHLGSGLTRINLLSELLLGDPPDQQAKSVGQITHVTCELMRAMDEIVWAVNPKNDTLDSLMSYLCDFANKFLDLAGIRLRISLPDALPAWNLTSEVRHNLFLSVKEILNNIVKHSQAGEVSLGLSLAAGGATLDISDNGRGFSPEALAGPHRGNGLQALQQWAAAIGGRCVVASQPGGGTRVTLTFPGQTTSPVRSPAANSILFGAI